ncbi:hypothetical protein V493_03310, partial [Pseudogymnoascus sp. VKM F-4281 (FW-2241)]
VEDGGAGGCGGVEGGLGGGAGGWGAEGGEGWAEGGEDAEWSAGGVGGRAGTAGGNPHLEACITTAFTPLPAITGFSAAVTPLEEQKKRRGFGGAAVFWTFVDVEVGATPASQIPIRASGGGSAFREIISWIPKIDPATTATTR